MSKTYKSICHSVSDSRRIKMSSQDDEVFVIKDYDGESIGVIAFNNIEDFNEFVDHLNRLKILANGKHAVHNILEDKDASNSKE